ncbi:MAG: glycosyltransferase family 2 protein, partial [Brevinema sp.]
LLIPTWNEGKRIQNQLKQIKALNLMSQIDIILMDGGSSDNSVNFDFLCEMGVRGILSIAEKGQGCAYRVGFNKVITDGYEFVITMDGNNKDNVDAIPQFIALLNQGYDFIQGSRFLKGGHQEHTPFLRKLGMMFFATPLLSAISGFKYTETMSAYRGFRVSVLSDNRLQIFRDIFIRWELQWYLAVRIPQLGYKVIETPQRRIYPPNEPIPTKITKIDNFRMFFLIIKVALGLYNP